MKLPHLAGAALFAISLSAASWLLRSPHAPTSGARPHNPSRPFPASPSTSTGALPQLAPLAAAERALGRAAAAGHWHPTPEWDALLLALSASDLAVLVPAAALLERRSVREPLLDALLRRWGERAPSAALAWLARTPDRKRHGLHRAAVVNGWVHADPESLLTWLREVPQSEDRRATLLTALPSLTRSHPAATFELLERTDPLLAAGHYGTLFSHWAARDPHAAAAKARTLSDTSSRHRALQAVVAAWSEYDPVAAFTFTRSLPRDAAVLQPTFRSCSFALDDPEAEWIPGPPSSGSFAGTALGHLAARDPDAALAAIRTLPSRLERDAALHDIARSLAANDPEMAAAFAAGLPPSPDRTELLGQLARAYAATDPGAALVWARQLPENSARHSALAAIAVRLAAADAPQALAVLATLPDSSTRSFGVREIVQTWAHRDTRAALAWAQSQADPQLRHELLAAVAPQWARLDPAAVFTHALQLPPKQQASFLDDVGHALAAQGAGVIAHAASQVSDADARHTLLRSAMASLALSSPAAAADLLQRFPLPNASFIASRIAESFASQDPDRAAQWAARLPGNLQAGALPSIVRTWAWRQPQEAAGWLSTLQPDLRDLAAGSYVDALAPTHPDLAAPMLATIGDPARRRDATERLARTWLRQDRSAADAWLASTDLSVEARQRLLRSHQRPSSFD